MSESLKSPEERFSLPAIRYILNRTKIDLKIDSIKLLSSSTFQIFEINHSWIVRISLSDNEKIHKEKTIVDMLKMHPNLTIPSYSDIYEIPEENISFVLYPKLQGETLTDEIYKQLTEPEKDILADAIASSLFQIHHTPNLKNILSNETDELLSGQFPRVPDPSILNEKMEKYLAYEEYAELLPLWRKVYNIYFPIAHDPNFWAPVHNDAHSGNLLIDPVNKQFSGILDFEDMAYGHISREFRHFYSLEPEFMIKVASAYAKKCNIDEKSFAQSTFAFRLYRDFTNLWKTIEFNHIASEGDKKSSDLLKSFLRTEYYQFL